MNAGLAGFASGLASGLQNLPSLMLAKRQMEIDQKRYEAERQWREHQAKMEDLRHFEALSADQAHRAATLAHQDRTFTAAGQRHADEMGLQRDVLSADQAHRAATLAHQDRTLTAEMRLKYFDRTSKEKNQAKKRAAATVFNVLRNSDSGHSAATQLTPYVRANGEMFRGLFGLSKDRIPVGVEFYDDPQSGIRGFAPIVYNKKTKSTGPMTEGASASPGDQVTIISPEVLRGQAALAAGFGLEKPAAAPPEEWRAQGGVLVEKNTGRTRPIPRSTADWTREIRDEVNRIVSTGLSNLLDSAQSTKWIRGILNRIGSETFHHYGAGEKGWTHASRALAEATRILGQENSLYRESLRKAKTIDDQERVLRKLFRQINAIPETEQKTTSSRAGLEQSLSPRETERRETERAYLQRNMLSGSERQSVYETLAPRFRRALPGLR